MVRIDLPEDYAVRQLREAVRDSLRSHGEEVILMHMFHVADPENTAERCHTCYNEVYKQGDNFDCPRCYGTTYEGGVKDIWRAWAIFTDNVDIENIGRRGVWHPVARQLHTEHIPDLWKRDYVVRVSRWTADHRVVSIEGIYVFDDVSNDTLRTGAQPGQTARDSVGQRASLNRISESMPVYKYPLVGRVFHRFDGKPR